MTRVNSNFSGKPKAEVMADILAGIKTRRA